MKKLTPLLIFLLIVSVACFEEKVKLTSAWTSSTSVENPESIYYDAATDLLFVSSVAGGGNVKDGKGWISQFSTDGKLISEKWVKGLNAPKGMRSHNGVLWVTDIDAVVSIDIKSGKILKRIEVTGSTFLNDLATTPEGDVYVSDTQGESIYLIRDSKPSIFMSGELLEAPNGLLFDNGKLYVAAWGKGIAKDWSTKVLGRLYSIDPASKKITYISKEPLGNLDGLELDVDGNFLVSDWMAGKVLQVTQEGRATLLTTGVRGYADIAFVRSKKLLLIPSMKESELLAFTKNY